MVVTLDRHIAQRGLRRKQCCLRVGALLKPQQELVAELFIACAVLQRRTGLFEFLLERGKLQQRVGKAFLILRLVCLIFRVCLLQLRLRVGKLAALLLELYRGAVKSAERGVDLPDARFQLRLSVRQLGKRVAQRPDIGIQRVHSRGKLALRQALCRERVCDLRARRFELCARSGQPVKRGIIGRRHIAGGDEACLHGRFELGDGRAQTVDALGEGGNGSGGIKGRKRGGRGIQTDGVHQRQQLAGG